MKEKLSIRELCAANNISLYRERHRANIKWRTNTWYYLGTRKTVNNIHQDLRSAKVFSNNIKVLFTCPHQVIYLKDVGLYMNKGKRKKYLTYPEVEFYVDVAKSEYELNEYGLHTIFNEPMFRIFLKHSYIRKRIYTEKGYVDIKDVISLYEDLSGDTLNVLNKLTKEIVKLSAKDRLKTFAYRYRDSSLELSEKAYREIKEMRVKELEEKRAKKRLDSLKEEN